MTHIAAANTTEPIAGPKISNAAITSASASYADSPTSNPVYTEAIVAGIEYKTRIHMNTPSREKLAGFGVPTTVGCSGIIPLSSGPYGSTLSQYSGPGAWKTHPLSSLFGL